VVPEQDRDVLLAVELIAQLADSLETMITATTLPPTPSRYPSRRDIRVALVSAMREGLVREYQQYIGVERRRGDIVDLLATEPGCAAGFQVLTATRLLRQAADWG
jgi:hypothetical protein